MNRLLALFVLLTSALLAEHPGWLVVEEEVVAEVDKSQITVVRLWAPWCPNSRAENNDGGWAKFIEANPNVQFVFVTVRSSDDGVAHLAEHDVGEQVNLKLLHHPNHVRRGEYPIFHGPADLVGSDDLGLSRWQAVLCD